MAALARGFLAIVPPDEVLQAVEDLLGREGVFDPSLRWTTRTQWHATLQFLGRVADVDAVVDAVGPAASTIVPPSVRLGGAGAFPKTRRGTVLWLGFCEGAGALAGLAAAVAGATATVDFDAADRRFEPHLTLARSRAPLDLRARIDVLGAQAVGPEWMVREVVLFESETLADGARYSEISRMPLAV